MTKVMAFPRRGDSYTDCFYPALEAAGVSVIEGVYAGRWLLKNLRGIDYVHVHWPSFFYSHPTRLRTLRQFAMFTFFMGLLHLRGARLIWTVHNVFPHDRCVIPWLDGLARRFMVKMAARFLIHGPSAEAEVKRVFPAVAGRTVLIDHGHWRGYYRNDVNRSDARDRLGLRDGEFAVLFIGLCKPYKNIGELVLAFDNMPSNAVLIIAGKFQDPRYENEIREAIDRSRARIIFRPGFVADDDMQIYLKASDVVALPYTDILTSGGAILALTFGRPVVAPRKGFLKDIISDECGLLYDPSKPDGLVAALQVAMQTRFDEAGVIAAALSHDWGKSAATVRAALV